MKAMTDDVLNTLLDVLNSSEVVLIQQTLEFRRRQLTRQREESLKWAADLVGEPERQKVYTDWAASDESQIQALAALITKLK
jgi:hypothetical protein